MEKTTFPSHQDQKRRILALDLLLLFVVGFPLVFVVFDFPKYPGRTATIFIDELDSPVERLEQLSNGTIWVAAAQYSLRPSLYNEMARDRGNIYAPDIIYDDGLYQMWYGGQSDDGHDSILYATSTDGKNWTKFGTVIPTGTNNHVNDPSVVKVNGIYYMYYSVAPVREMDEVWGATSVNGINWTIMGPMILPDTDAERWDSLKVGRPSVLYQDGLFKMWFDGSQRNATDATQVRSGTGRHVGYATSSNGYNWTKWANNPIVLNSGAIDVEFFDGKYVMVEESGDGILYRIGLNETNFDPTPQWLFKKMGTSYDAYGHVTPFILIIDGKWVATYTGAATVRTWDQNRIAIWYPQLNNSITTNYNSDSPVVHRPWAYNSSRSSYTFSTARGDLPYLVQIRPNSNEKGEITNVIAQSNHIYRFERSTMSLVQLF
jgi:predicted GH43/DUF377 family glycosyl hydrolase